MKHVDVVSGRGGGTLMDREKLPLSGQVLPSWGSRVLSLPAHDPLSESTSSLNHRPALTSIEFSMAHAINC